MNNFLFVGLVVLLFVAGPLLVIWALNTLFPLNIPYDIETWFAVVVLASVFKTTIAFKRDI